MSEDRSMEISPVPLSSLQVGESGIIVKLNIKGTARQRFMAMGLVRGETITVERVAPLGDPVEFLVKGYHLSIRKSEASQILVQPSIQGWD
jgi:Fe2+ transport system protein FeoA